MKCDAFPTLLITCVLVWNKMADSGYTSESNNIQTIILEKGEKGYGFNIRGGTDNCHVGQDPGIFVTSMRPDGAAAKDGRLKKGDRIISVNGRNISKVLHQAAVDAFRVASEKVVLVVESGAEMKIKKMLDEKEKLMYTGGSQAVKKSSDSNVPGKSTLSTILVLPYAKIVFGVATIASVYFMYKNGWFQSLWRKITRR